MKTYFEQIEQKRDEELVQMKKSRLLSATMSLVNEFIPIIAKLVVFAIYVRSYIIPSAMCS